MTAALRDRVLSIGADPRDTADERFRKRLLVGVAVVILPFGFVWGCLYWLVGERAVALTPWAYVAGSAASLVVFARNRNFAFLRTAQQVLILVAPASGMVMLGGLDESSSVVLWSLFAPLGAVAFDRPGRAWPWFAAFVATILVALALTEVVRPDAADLPGAFVRTFDVLNIVVVSLVALLLLVTFAQGREAAQARVESLLLNVLPAEIAQRLQSDPNSIADQFDDVSILFADVVDFTPLSSRLDAREVVEFLDDLFCRFDELVDRYEVEKIKTIGDCYMVAAGVPRQRSDHAHALAAVALEMRECAKTCLPAGADNDLRLRIGISSGPVVAGVIGRRRFLYDLWGDTVNMASRMESHGTPDCIQITRSTWELLRTDFVTEPLGLVDVKGKGAVETWRLVGPRETAGRGAAPTTQGGARVPDELLEAVRAAVELPAGRDERSRRIADLLRAATGRRWVGVYDVTSTEVVNLAWSGPAPPAHPRFPVERGLTAAAIATRQTVVSNDVARDPRYLTALTSTGSELIVPVIAGGRVVGTLDVEDERTDAFDDEDRRLFERAAREMVPLYD